MKDFLTFGLVGWFFLVPLGCAHTSDSPASMPRQQEVAQAQTNVAPAQQVAPVAQPNGTPSVELSETVFDFGLVSDGTDYLHAFKIRNVGTGDLVIKKILPG
ncbi:MAG: hypothetical protein ABSE08_17200 [Syntrophobacteraceae bacterium]|jgi:hypothetical protein